MIKMILDRLPDGSAQYATAVICESCGERIADHADCNCVYFVSRETGEPLDGTIYTVHKGICDMAFSHKRPAGTTPFWIEFRVMFTELRENVKLGNSV